MFKKLSNIGDCGIVCDFGEEVNREANTSVIKLFDHVKKEVLKGNLNGILNYTPSYNKLIIYFEFLLLIKKGFTLSIITSFKTKNKLFYNELIKRYASGKGAKWILLDRLNSLNELKIINLNKNIKLTSYGNFLSVILIFLRKILSIRDFG